MSARAQAAGFSLVEILVSMAVLGTLLAVGLPSYLTWMQNAQIRTAAESISNGLQVAKNEAIRRNARVQFQLTNLTAWQINLASDPGGTPIQARAHEEGSANAIVTMFPDNTATTVTFNSLGRVVSNADGTTTLTRVLIENPVLNTTDMRPLNVVIPQYGGVRMCDPKVAAGDPRGCPAVFP